MVLSEGNDTVLAVDYCIDQEFFVMVTINLVVLIVRIMSMAQMIIHLKVMIIAMF